MLRTSLYCFIVTLSALSLRAWPAQLAATAQQSSPPSKAEQKPTPQQPAPTPEQQPDAEAVVRITTQLVQIDAVVTDRKGAHVEDLTEDDFELTVDGKKQPLTYFKLIKLPEPKPAEQPAKNAVKENKNAAAPTTMPTRMVAPEEVNRTIAFVVDDLGLSFESTYYTREALKKFVREQMQEGDLVGIIRTGRGGGALQQFTSDKRVLYAAIEKLSWNPISRDMIPRFGAVDPNDARSQEARDAEGRFEDFRETVFSVGTLGALNFVVRGLRELPGRKMAVLVSDGFRLFGRNGDNDQVLQNLRRLVDLANRASVVIYSIDAKGLQTLMPDATTSGTPRPEDYQRVSQQNFDAQEGLTYVARETGGLAFLNNNDINLGIQRALKDAQSYYLLGFDPEDEKFDRKYHSIKLKLAHRPGLQVRTRAGFLGVPDRSRREDLAEAVGPAARDRQILGALYSPFGARDIPLQMTSFFFSGPNPKRGQKNEAENISFVRSLLHIDPSKLTFKDHPQEPGKKQLQIEIVNFLFNEIGVVVDQRGYRFGLTYDGEQLKRLLAGGLTYTDDFVMKKPGAYQFRMVLRDPESGQLGSAGQFIQVPDLTKKRLALSGLVLTAAQPEQNAGAAPPTAATEINPSPAVRRFARSSLLDYGAVAYNATLDASGKPQLLIQVEIYQNGKQIYQSPARAAEGVVESKLIECRGRLKLTSFPPGDYLLHLIATDALAKQKYARAEQWIDFQVR